MAGFGYDHGYERESAMEDMQFQDPGGRSSLRRATNRNPRNLPCPTCGKANRLTAQDKAAGYQCNDCADRVEGCYVGADY